MKVVREVFIGRQITRSIINCYELKSERAKFVYFSGYNFLRIGSVNCFSFKINN